VHILSPVARPTSARPWTEDRRRLGVGVRRMRVDGAGLPLDGPAVGAGWHAPERDCRWTDGDGHLHLPPGGQVLELHVTG
jgi:hypothetical protein